MQVLVIGNPNAGNGQGQERIRAFAAALEAGGHRVETFLTRRAGDGRERAGGPMAGFDRLVVAGGDGTLNEVLNGLAEPGRVPLALLPCGTANLLAHDLGLPWDPPGLARVAVGGGVRTIDLGLVRGAGVPAAGRRFLLCASAGFDALVTREIHQRRTGTLGYLGYLRPVLGTMLSYRPPRLTVSLDGGAPEPAAYVLAAKTRNYGGIFVMADRARLDSGAFDVCLFDSAHALTLAKAMVAGLTGGLSGKSWVRYRQARRVRIESAGDPVPAEVDGDCIGDTPVEIELVPAAVRVVGAA